MDQNFDIVIGHFADTSAPMFGHLINLKYLKTQLYCLGDIHTRISKNYIGSVFACKISENETPRPRGVWKVVKDGDTVIKEEIAMPHFCDFKVVNYPEALPKETSPVTVWTVLGADNETIAKSFYKDKFIRGVHLSRKKKDKQAAVSADDFEFSDPLGVFKDWMKEVKEPISRPTAKLVRSLLEPPKTTKVKVSD